MKDDALSTKKKAEDSRRSSLDIVLTERGMDLEEPRHSLRRDTVDTGSTAASWKVFRR